MPPEMDDMADAAGEAATDAYEMALENGTKPSQAAADAIDAAATVMTNMGAPTNMVEKMSSAAQNGFDSALAKGASPEDAFSAAADSVEKAMSGEEDFIHD